MATDWPSEDGAFAAKLAEFADGNPGERKLLFDYGPLIFPRLVRVACAKHSGLRAAGLDALGRLIRIVGLGRMLVRALCSESGLSSADFSVQKECSLAVSRVMQACMSMQEEDRENIGWIRVLPHLVRLCAHPFTTQGAEQALQHLRVLLGPRSFHRRFTRALLAFHEASLEREAETLERKESSCEEDMMAGLKISPPKSNSGLQTTITPSGKLSWTLWVLVKEGPLDTSVDGLRALAEVVSPHPDSARDILITLLPMIESFDIEVSEAALTAATVHYDESTCSDIVASHPMASTIAKKTKNHTASTLPSSASSNSRRQPTPLPFPSTHVQSNTRSASREQVSARSVTSNSEVATLRQPSLDLSEVAAPDTSRLISTPMDSSSLGSNNSSPKPSIFASAGHSMLKMNAQLSTLKRKTSGRRKLASASSSDDLRPHSASRPQLGSSGVSSRSSPLSASSTRSAGSEYIFQAEMPSEDSRNAVESRSSARSYSSARNELAVAAARGAYHQQSSYHAGSTNYRAQQQHAAHFEDQEHQQQPQQYDHYQGSSTHATGGYTNRERNATSNRQHSTESLASDASFSMTSPSPSVSSTASSQTPTTTSRNSQRRQRSAPTHGHSNPSEATPFAQTYPHSSHSSRTAPARSHPATTVGDSSARGNKSDRSTPSDTSEYGNEYEAPPKLSARDDLPRTVDGIVKALLDDSQWQDQVRALNAIKSNQHTSLLPPNCRSEPLVIQAVIKLTSSLRSVLSKSSLLCLHFLINDNGRSYWKDQTSVLIDAIVAALIKRSIDASAFLAQEARSALDACVQSFPPAKLSSALLQHCHSHANARARANAAAALHAIVQTAPASAYDSSRVISCAKDKLLHDNSVEARAAAKGILLQLNETHNLDRKQQMHLERITSSSMASGSPHRRKTQGGGGLAQSKGAHQQQQTLPSSLSSSRSINTLEVHGELLANLHAREWQSRLRALQELQSVLSSQFNLTLFAQACESARDANVRVKSEAVRAVRSVASRYAAQIPASQLSTLLLPVAAAAGDRPTQQDAVACLRDYLRSSPQIEGALRRHLPSLPPKAKASLRPLLPTAC